MPDADLARAALVDALVTGERIRSPAVEEAFRAVPRDLFLPGLPISEAYADDAVAVQHVDGVATSSASQPSMMAIMLEQLELRPGHRVLEIGAGTGYNAALMARIVGPEGSVTAVDIDADLVAAAAANLAAAGVADVRLVCGDGALGHPDEAPYDRIVLTVGSSDVQPVWVSELAPRGRLLLPLAVAGSQLSVALDRGEGGLLRSRSVRSCGFIRLRGAAADARPIARCGPLTITAAEGFVPDTAAIADALEAPGEVRRTAVALGQADVRDGFGLWLSVTEPGVVRLAPDPADANGAGQEVVALVAGRGVGIVRSPDGRAEVQAYGPDGPAPAARLHAAVRDWAGAGSPNSADLEMMVAPSGAGEPDRTRWTTRVDKAHCVLWLRWADRS